MTDTIEQKALALVNEVKSNGLIQSTPTYQDAFNALCRAIEQHEAFRQEVSDAVETLVSGGLDQQAYRWFRMNLERFIITKPDPLVEALNDLLWAYDDNGNAMADQLRAAIEARGGKITWGEG